MRGTEFNASLFADDATFIMDGTRRSLETLINILDNLSYISRLRLYKQMPCSKNRFLENKTIEYLKSENMYGVLMKQGVLE